jgi:hypothetical protein
MSYYVKKLWIKFTKKPEYCETQYNSAVNFLSEYPNISFLGYLLVKNYFFPTNTEKTQDINTIMTILKLSINLLFFQGVILEYLPNSVLSSLLKGVIIGLIYNSPDISLYYFFTGLSRLRYSLDAVLSYKILYTAIVLLLNKVV